MPKYYDEHYESTEQDFTQVYMTNTKKEVDTNKKEKSIGEKIKSARQSAILSQLKLARHLKISTATLEKIETNQIPPTKMMCKKINQICNTDFSYVI